jgi:argininosuccinate lyase
MVQFNNSIDFDKRWCYVDLEGSRAYARATERVGILTKDEANKMIEGLGAVEEEWRAGTFEIKASDEDIHTANERRLSEIIGADVAGKLHTGRSRNDQVATDARLWLRDEIDSLSEDLLSLIDVAVERASREIDIIMPGYTHLQPAQPIRWSHWMLSHAAGFRRDYQRLQDLKTRVNIMPLGSGALAGHPFGIDRQLLAQDLKFDGVSSNSMDAVADRDYVCEFLFWASMTGIHLSRLAEDLIVYGSSEFGFVKQSDAYSTGSSLMPQKKNPDALELLRGKAGPAIGDLTSVLVSLKGIPTTYNKDLQEGWPPLYRGVDMSSACINIATGVLSTLEPVPHRMSASLAPEMLATDMADYLVRRGVPFRETHHLAGECVALAESRGCTLHDLTKEDLVDIHECFNDIEASIPEVFSMESSVEARSAMGGTSRSAVLKQCEEMQDWITMRRYTPSQQLERKYKGKA